MPRLLAALTLLLLAAPARAGFDLELKLAYGVPMGSVFKAEGGFPGGAMRNAWSWSLPIGVAGRYRLNEHLSAGVYYQYAPAFVSAQACDPGASCSGYDMRVGLEVVLATRPYQGLSGWFSVGSGWEWTRLSGAVGGQAIGLTVSGWEYFVLQAGLDFFLYRDFCIGPYLGFSGGTYTNATGSGAAVAESSTIDTSVRAFHGWWQFGMKATARF